MGYKVSEQSANIIMNKINRIQGIGTVLWIAGGLLTAVMSVSTSRAYSTYSGTGGSCADCHGDFRGPTSPKGTVFPAGQNHEMHRASTNMATACNLCHTGTSRTPVYTWQSNGTANNTGIGCSGCHVGPGLRKHHQNNGVTVCYDCHDPSEVADPENVKPPYYGTADTRVKNPGNPVQAANTNENWSVGDFLGLDNDGNNLYDQADYAINPLQVASAKREGNSMRVTWNTAGGRTEMVQVASKLSGPYTNLSPAMVIPGVGVRTTNYLDVGGATQGMRFYRVTGQVP
jgi:hypothetical protein